MATSTFNVEGLTSNLMLELDRTGKMFDRWCERQVDSLDSLENNYYQSMEEYDHTLQALRENEQQLEEARVLNDEIKREQEEQIAAASSELHQLRMKQSEMPQELTQLDRQHREEVTKLENMRNQLAAIRADAAQMQNDMLFGLDKYKRLGLEFASTPDRQGLTFVFTQIDAREPMRPFKLVICVDESSNYHATSTTPALNPATVNGLVGQLNADQNLGRFVACVRRLFKQVV